MNSNIGRLVLGFGAVGLMLAGAALADGHREGGHFEGGHGGGGHAAAPAHFQGHAHFAAPAAHFQGPARAQIQPHYGGGARYAQPAFRGSAPRTQFAPGQHYANADHGHWGGDRGGRGGDGGRQWGGEDHRWGDGDHRWGGDHDRYWAGTYWGGGYWGNSYWPQVFYGVDFSWFLPVLPGVYSTYWYGGIPYYYANDAYYIWDPSYDGYVATDPPPVASSADAQPAAPSDAGAQIFMYPKNGQSAEQQREDRIACERWAANQVGNGGTNSDDYRRAMTACAEGRGYSVR